MLSITTVVLAAALVVASGFALWSVVADAPWEEEPVTIIEQHAPPTPTVCQRLRQEYIQAGTERVARLVLGEMVALDCPNIPGGRLQPLQPIFR